MFNFIKERAAGVLLILMSALLCLLTGDATALFFTVPCGVLVLVKPEVIKAERASAAQERKRKLMETYEIRNVRGHYEIYVDGEFLCSGDTQRECLAALDELPLDAA